MRFALLVCDKLNIFLSVPQKESLCDIKMKKILLLIFVILSMSITAMAQRYVSQVIIQKYRFVVHSQTHSFWSGRDDYRESVRINLPSNTEYWYYSVSVCKIDNQYKSADCNIYLLDKDENYLFVNYGNFQYYNEGTRKFFSEGRVNIESHTRGVWYLGFANPSLRDGVRVELEVVAMVRQ